MERQPIKLEKDPIVEAVFEVRFATNSDQMADLMPGILFPQLLDKFPKISSLPAANIPKVIRDQDPQLRYQASRRAFGPRLQVSLGDRVAAVSCPSPYIGWSEFQPVILRLIRLLKDSALIKQVERFSLKYVNLLSGMNPKEQFAHTRFTAQLDTVNLVEQLTQVRTQIIDRGFINIVELSANASVRHASGKTSSGLLLSIDTISDKPNDFWVNSETLLKEAHEVEKYIFFHALTKDAIEKLQPIW